MRVPQGTDAHLVVGLDAVVQLGGLPVPDVQLPVCVSRHHVTGERWKERREEKKKKQRLERERGRALFKVFPPPPPPVALRYSSWPLSWTLKGSASAWLWVAAAVSGWVGEIAGINECPGFNFRTLDRPKIDGGRPRVSSTAEPRLLH